MSQRGLRPGRTRSHQPTTRWHYIRISIAFAIALTLGTALTLQAQNMHNPTQPTKTVLLRVDGTVRKVATAKETVQTLLHQEKVILKDHDLVEPVLATAISEGMTVTVHRVTYVQVVERVSIAPKTVTRFDRRMSSTPVRVSEGRPGVALQTRCMWKKDGVVTVQWTTINKVIVPAKPIVVLRGQAPSRGSTGRRVLTMTATAYTPYDAGCNGITATGARATRGIIAVDPRVIPLGTRVYVDGYGPAVAADTGGAIKRNVIDVCFPTKREAFSWGRRKVTVIVLD
ncbi:MAG: G5 and 3D domain-containing protein [Armatimonadota bacterium]